MLLAALAADGATTVGEPERSRDHTERMLLRAGVTIHRNGRHVTVVNADELVLEHVAVPGDPSSAAFMIAAGVLVPGSRLLLARRRRQLDAHRLPAHPAPHAGHRARRARGRDRRADRATSRSATSTSPHGALEGTVVEAEEVPLAIDELPLVALLGCFAEGETSCAARRSCA